MTEEYRQRPCPLCEHGERENDSVCPSCAARLDAEHRAD